MRTKNHVNVHVNVRQTNSNGKFTGDIIQIIDTDNFQRAKAENYLINLFGDDFDTIQPYLKFDFEDTAHVI